MSSPATFTPELVASFRAMAWRGEQVAPAARAVGVKPNTVGRAVRGESQRWSRETLGVPPVPARNTERRSYAWDQAAGAYVQAEVQAHV